MKNKTSKIFSAVYIFFIISCILLSAYLVFDVWARYFTKTDGTDSARAARYVFAIDVKDNNNDSISFDLSDISTDNPQKVFDIVITNKNGSNICEVTQQYTISAEILGSLPLSYAFEYDGTPVPQEILPAGEETTHTYKLTVKWDTTKAVQGANANILDNASIMTITVASEQID